jgi:hypothetical protein
MKFNNLNILKNNTKIENFDYLYNQRMDEIINIFDANADCVPLLIVITGSISYGIDTETSDIDLKGVYIQDLNSILKELKIGESNPLYYKNQIENDKNDIVLYELGRIIQLLQTNNPNSLELLSTPEDCVIYKHPIWDEIVAELIKSNVITKKCYFTFHNYASQQIKKATGLNKKINNPIAKERKTPLDFCYVIFEDESTMLLRPFLEREKYDQRLCGLVKVPHARDLYGLYYDFESAKSFSRYEEFEKREQYRLNKLSLGESMGLGYKGIIKEDEEKNNKEVSDEIRLSSISKNEKRVALISYNKDSYMQYCKDYTSYWGKDGWMNKRNEVRYNDNISSGQNYDGKNLSHCLRLLYMAKEIAENKGIIVKRNSELREQLLEIKKGKWSYEDIMNRCKELTDGLKELYDNSDLPDEIPNEILSEILLKYRKKFYFNS